MKYIWFGFFFEILLLVIIKLFVFDNAAVGILAVFLHMIFTMFVLMSYKVKEKVIFLIAFIARTAFMFWDLYASNIFKLPNSGADTEIFYYSSVSISRDLTLLGSTRGGMLANLMGLLFKFIGPQRIIGQYINVLFGLSTVFIVYKILLMIDINKKTAKIILLIAAIFPNSLIMSAIFLREIIPTFFMATSLYYFLKWVKYQKLSNALLTLVMVGIASMFHSGVIGVVLGYFYGFLFYHKKDNKLKFSTKTVISFVFVVVVIAISFTYFDDVLFGKFSKIDEIGDVYDQANRRAGSSTYLTGLTINNPLQLAIFGPIKSLFFLTSPLPMNWRGFMDIFTFMTDSMLYLITIVYLVKNRKMYGENQALIICIIWMIVGGAFIFGIGVNNAGTAVRHRQKLVAIFLVLLGLIMDGKKKYLMSKIRE